MCGINLFVTRAESYIVKDVLWEMNNTMKHRGPDGSYVRVDLLDNMAVGMAMVRLAINDSEGGIQPMYYPEKNTAIIFNGEIYNYIELRDSLKAKGYNFTTESDTEVLLVGLSEYGCSFLNRCDGMFAYALLHLSEGRIDYGRDDLGEKPLFFYQDEDVFLLSSEVKSLVKGLKLIKKSVKFNWFAIRAYLRYSFIPDNYTMFCEIFSVEPGAHIEFELKDKSLKQSIRSEDPTRVVMNQQNDLEKTLVNSILNRHRCDVDVALLLSGGKDSSIIAGVLSKFEVKVHCYTARFQDTRFNEDIAYEIASGFGFEHSFVEIPKVDSSAIYRIHEELGELNSDPAIIPLYYLLKEAGKDYKVVLSGDGGDEMFGGYSRYAFPRINKFYTKIVPQALHSKIKDYFVLREKNDSRGFRFKLNKFVEAVSYNSAHSYDSILSLGLKQSEIAELIEDNYYVSSRTLVDINTDLRKVDRSFSLPYGLLRKSDLASMANSVELRAPFLSKTILPFVNEKKGSRVKYTKEPMLKVMHSYRSNSLKGKKGFTVPIGTWLRDEWIKLFDEMLIKHGGTLAENGINVAVVKRWFNLHVKGSHDYSHALYCLLVLLINLDCYSKDIEDY